MTKEKASDIEPCTTLSDDLNDLALSEFRQLIASEKNLNEEWKRAVLKLTVEGIPNNLASLHELIGGGINVETEEPEG
jgi:hypothetical protein